MPKYSEESCQMIEDFIHGHLSKEKHQEVQQRINVDAAFADEVAKIRAFLATLKGLEDPKKLEVLDAFREIHGAAINPSTQADSSTTSSKTKSGDSILSKVAIVLLSLLIASLAWFALSNSETGQIELPPINTEAETPNPLDKSPQVTQPPKQEEPKNQITPPVPEKNQPSKTQQTPKKPTKDIIPASSEEKPVASTTPKPETEQPKPLAQQVPNINWEEYVAYRSGQNHLSGESDLLDQGVTLLQKGAKREALPLLEQHLTQFAAEEEEEDFDTGLEVGKIYLEELKNFDKAISIFKEIKTGDALDSYIQEATFYLALSYLAKGDRPAAKQELQSVLTTEDYGWHLQATELLRLLSI